MHADRYFVQTKAGQERKVRERLGHRGIRATVPLTRRFERQRSGRSTLHVGPAIPGYVIPRLHAGQFEGLRDVKDCCPRPLRSDGKVRPMSKAERVRIAEILRDPPDDPRDPYKGRGKPDPNKPPFKTNQTVKILSGPFALFSAVVERVWLASKRWQVRVEVSIFGRPTPVDMDAAALAAA